MPIKDILIQTSESNIEIFYDSINDNIVIGQGSNKIVYIEKEELEVFAYKLLIIKRQLQINKILS